jgi:hypothetical protein
MGSDRGNLVERENVSNPFSFSIFFLFHPPHPQASPPFLPLSLLSPILLISLSVLHTHTYTQDQMRERERDRERVRAAGRGKERKMERESKRRRKLGGDFRPWIVLGKSLTFLL